MSISIADIYHNSHGAVVIMRHWLAKDSPDLPLWPIQGYLLLCEEYFGVAFREFEIFCETAAFTKSDERFCYFALALGELIQFSEIVVTLAHRDHALVVPNSLVSAIERAKQILAEDSFAMEMGMINLAESDPAPDE
jgi:hypothetical protein